MNKHSTLLNMLILLDIDGAMVPASNWKVPELLSDGFPDFSAKAVCSLNNIIAETNASVLLTTSHKTLYNEENWKEIFHKRGIDVSIAILSSEGKPQNRMEEIERWFDNHSEEPNFLIIDDAKSLNGLPSALKHRLILTSPLIGLNDELAMKTIEILNEQSLAQT
jgi:hypothetical protein